MTRNVLLMHHIAIHCHEHIESSLNRLRKQLAVLNPGPSNQRHRFGSVPGQIATQSPIEVLIQ